MPNVNTISFGPGQMPDMQAEQIKLQRQQAMADMLRQQSMTPMETQVVSGRAVKNSPWLGVAQLAKALMANRMQGQNDERQTALGKAMAAQQAAQFDAMAGTPAKPAPADNIGMLGLPADDAPPAQAAPQLSQIDQIRNQAKAAYLMGNKDLANKLLENISTLTTEQRNMAAMGQNPLEMGRLGTAAARKGGIIELQPGTTALDLSNGQERFQPKVGEGISLNNGTATAIPGYANANAGITGASEAAKAAAQAGYQLKEYTPQGGTPMLSTVGNIVGTAGQPPAPPANQGFPPSTQLPAPTPGMQPREAVLNPEMAALQALPDSDPSKAPRIAALQRTMAAPQGSMPGIPLQTPAQAAQAVGQVNNNLAIEKARIEAAQSPEAIQKLTDAQGVVGLAGMARELLTKGQATGSMAGQLRDTVAGAVGVSTKSSQAAAQLAAIGASLTSKMPKMTGPQSDKDVLDYKTMAGRVGDASLPIGDRLAALDVIETINKKYLANNENSIANEALGANVRNGKIRKYNPVTQRIE